MTIPDRLKLVFKLIALIAVIGGADVRTVNAQVQDTTAPVLAEFDFNPKTVDVSGGPQTVTITLRITDDLSGFEFGNLKNSDDVGTKFDLRADVSLNGVLIGTGQLDGVSGGSSGFNNAVLRTINPALFTPLSVCPGDTLSLKLSVRIAANVSGHRSGTARLWFNDAAANSQFSTTMGGAATANFLLNGFSLGSVAGPGPKKTIDVFVDRAVGGNPFKPFGAWSKTF